MAAAPQQAVPAFPVIDQVFEVPIAQIDASDRLRPIDRIWAAALGAIMEREGHRTPVELARVGSGLKLVAGGHRLEGRRLQGHTTIRAVIVAADRIAARQAEISENLWRKDLEPIDRAAFVAELVALEKLRKGVDPAKDGRTASAAARWSAKKAAADATETISSAYGWADEVGAHLGLTGRTIRNDLALHRGLIPDVAAKLRGHPVSRNAGQLQALAKLSADDQRAVAGMLLDKACRGVSEAVATLRQRPKPSPEAKAWSAFFGSWGRMSAARRRDALRELAEQGLPAGVRISFDGDAQ